jgi:hypothetical protein
MIDNQRQMTINLGQSSPQPGQVCRRLPPENMFALMARSIGDEAGS